MTKFANVAILVTTLSVIAGCNSTSALNTQAPPLPLPAAPAGSIEGAQLDPLVGGNQLQPTELEAGQPVPNQVSPQSTQPQNNTQIAVIDPVTPQPTSPAKPAISTPLNHEKLAGAWSVTSDSPDCRIFLSFTQWSGGYRAGTRRCQEAELTTITAWDIKDSRVVLFDNGGKEIARLGAVGPEEYSGNTSSGKLVAFSR